MPHDATVTINGGQWQLVYRKLRNNDGECDRPDTPNRRISIRSGLKKDPLALLETLIHESFHGGEWPLSEEFVTRAAKDAARIAWDQGFRLTE